MGEFPRRNEWKDGHVSEWEINYERYHSEIINDDTEIHEINWTCTLCETENVDIYEDTVRPLCSGCDVDFSWEEVFQMLEVT